MYLPLALAIFIHFNTFVAVFIILEGPGKVNNTILVLFTTNLAIILLHMLCPWNVIFYLPHFKIIKIAASNHTEFQPLETATYSNKAYFPGEHFFILNNQCKVDTIFIKSFYLNGNTDFYTLDFYTLDFYNVWRPTLSCTVHLFYCKLNIY